MVRGVRTQRPGVPLPAAEGQRRGQHLRQAGRALSARAPVTNRVEVRVVGLSRSGNHAIIEWMLAQARGRVCFLNCAEPGHNPFDWARPISESEDGARASYPGFDRDAEARGVLSRKDVLVHSYEDVLLSSFGSPAAEETWIGRSARRVHVLILRDPFNLLASRIASGFAYLDHDIALRVWCDHAREFLGDTRLLPGERVMVSYDRWVGDRSHRRAIARKLGLGVVDDDLPDVARTGGGSSFDDVRFREQPDRMAVHDRWRTLLDHPEHLALFTAEVLALRERVFGPVPTGLSARHPALAS